MRDMKSIDYIVECPYCGQNYVVNIKKGSENFQCPNCGGQNGLKNVVQTLASLPEEERGKYKRVYIKEEQQESIDAIKKFNLSGYSFAYDKDAESETSAVVGVVIGLLALLVGFTMLLIRSFPH